VDLARVRRRNLTGVREHAAPARAARGRAAFDGNRPFARHGARILGGVIAFVAAARHRHILLVEDFERTAGSLLAEVDGEHFVDRSEDSHQPLFVVLRPLFDYLLRRFVPVLAVLAGRGWSSEQIQPDLLQRAERDSDDAYEQWLGRVDLLPGPSPRPPGLSG